MEPTRVIKGSYRDAVRRARALERLGKGVELTQESQRLGGSRQSTQITRIGGSKMEA